MSKTEKYLITALIALTNISSILLWLTKTSVLKSQSMYFDEPNKVFYIGMHIGIIMTFFILAARIKNTIGYGLVAFFSIFTLMFDLGGSKVLHDISTALLFLTACLSIVKYGSMKFLEYYIVLCSIAVMAFAFGLVGWLGSSGIFLGESVTEICLSICVLIEIYKGKKLS